MSKILKHALLPIITTCCISSYAIANENTASPISFILNEAGVSESMVTKSGKKAYTPHIGYETVMLKTKNRSEIKIHGKNIKKKNKIDNIHLNLGQNKARCEELEKKLTAQYGPPKSQRNNIRIWELNNPDFTSDQSRKITIMAGKEKGEYFLTVDRKGTRTGNNPRSNDSLTKPYRNKIKRQQSRKTQPKVNHNIRD